MITQLPVSRAQDRLGPLVDDLSDMLWAQETLLREVLDEHTPLKSKRVWSKEPAFMNETLKKSKYNKQYSSDF